jgi:uncharacterized cupredoxin-like copper-binding protein
MKAHRILSLSVVCLTALALVACGGQTSLAPRSISLKLVEFTITPNTSTAQVGEPLTFAIHNQGVLEHNITIVNSDQEQLALVTVEPGQSADLEFTPSASGQLEIICTIAGHQKAGMTAELSVNP